MQIYASLWMMYQIVVTVTYSNCFYDRADLPPIFADEVRSGKRIDKYDFLMQYREKFFKIKKREISVII